MRRVVFSSLIFFFSTIASFAELPPVPVPVENPITEQKRILGKILFWDEQLSSDNTVACGTCHLPASGGSDPRVGIHPGTDPGTIDDVYGSPGIISLDSNGKAVNHPQFGKEKQVTPRSSLSNFSVLWAEELFWDGRAGGEFRDPLTNKVVIASGGALETQALMPLVNSMEMAKTGRRWSEITEKINRIKPLALATNLPGDLKQALETHSSYPELFAVAFGDDRITPVRIAFALASYQRTLVADQTAWDRFSAGETNAISQKAKLGWEALQEHRCVNCHTPPLFTNNRFFNIGVRHREDDAGRGNVTGDPEDAGDMKVPSLRNAALRPRFFHTGEFKTLPEAINFYEVGPQMARHLPGIDDIPEAGTYVFSLGVYTMNNVLIFIEEGLTDPRVRDETFPFDRPTLASERDQAGRKTD